MSITYGKHRRLIETAALFSLAMGQSWPKYLDSWRENPDAPIPRLDPDAPPGYGPWIEGNKIRYTTHYEVPEISFEFCLEEKMGKETVTGIVVIDYDEPGMQCSIIFNDEKATLDGDAKRKEMRLLKRFVKAAKKAKLEGATQLDYDLNLKLREMAAREARRLEEVIARMEGKRRELSKVLQGMRKDLRSTTPRLKPGAPDGRVWWPDATAPGETQGL